MKIFFYFDLIKRFFRYFVENVFVVLGRIVEYMGSLELKNRDGR